MSLLNEAFIQLAVGWRVCRGRCQPGEMTRMQQRELAEMMRRLPSRYGDRLTTRALERIMDAAAAGRWEKAVDQLITALCIHGEPISAAERDELGVILEALGMPSGRIETLTLRS